MTQQVGTDQGTYTTRRGVVYTYTISWFKEGNGCRWDATVKRHDEVVKRPHGEIHNLYHHAPIDLASAQLKYAIESGDRDDA
jgi:hypothetical protein